LASQPAAATIVQTLRFDEESSMQVDRLDHLVLTVVDIDVTSAFYEKVLGMRPVTFAEGRKALVFGRSKINLHSAKGPFEPHAKWPTPGSADLCFIVATTMDALELVRK
jgi:catechol 2,3-dioxygenase-like lactoylglutathione lyase family enzyme